MSTDENKALAFRYSINGGTTTTTPSSMSFWARA